MHKIIVWGESTKKASYKSWNEISEMKQNETETEILSHMHVLSLSSSALHSS